MITSNQKKTALYCRLSQDDNTEILRQFTAFKLDFRHFAYHRSHDSHNIVIVDPPVAGAQEGSCITPSRHKGHNEYIKSAGISTAVPEKGAVVLPARNTNMTACAMRSSSRIDRWPMSLAGGAQKSITRVV